MSGLIYLYPGGFSSSLTLNKTIVAEAIYLALNIQGDDGKRTSDREPDGDKVFFLRIHERIHEYEKHMEKRRLVRK